MKNETLKYKLKKPLPFAPKGSKVTLRWMPTWRMYDLVIYGTDGEHAYEVHEGELKEWLKFIKPKKQKGK